MAAYTKNLAEKWTALYVRLSRDDENEGTATALPTKLKSSPNIAKTTG